MVATNEIEELKHLALYSMQHDQPDRALEFLKQWVALSPEDATAHYLMGAVHAQIGMYERAIEEMRKATSIDRSLYPAHFQLGLLHATSGNLDEAVKAWAPLEDLDEKNPLLLFKIGMEHLLRDEFEQCVAFLKEGIALNQAIPSLNNDMAKVIRAAENAAAGSGAKSSPRGEQKPGRHFLLSSYEESDDDNETKH